MRKRRKAAEATSQAEASSLAGAQFYLVQSSFRSDPHCGNGWRSAVGEKGIPISSKSAIVTTIDAGTNLQKGIYGINSSDSGDNPLIGCRFIDSGWVLVPPDFNFGDAIAKSAAECVGSADRQPDRQPSRQVEPC
jgi:hypothetical protein